MATLASSSSSVSPLRYPPSEPPYCRLSFLPPSFVRFNIKSRSLRPQRLVLASSSSSSSSSTSFEDFSSKDSSRSQKSVLSDLIHEIEPLDVSLIQKDVPPTTVEAIKRTVSGMLGLLPSNQFQVMIEALWEPLSKLLVSSMMTGYTLRNAEYRLCLERNFGIYDENIEYHRPDGFSVGLQEMLLDSVRSIRIPDGASATDEGTTENQPEEVNLQGLGDMSPEAKSYILQLQSRLFSVKKELHEFKRKNAALQMQQFVGEEKNDLLDYLRSLQPEKVAELSEPASPELKETIRSVVHGLLATLSPKMHSKASPFSEKNTAAAGAVNVGNDDCAELVENTSLHFQPIISLTRDYLARLLFWCMLLGHYLRGLEYRMELMDLFAPSSSPEDGASGVKQIS